MPAINCHSCKNLISDSEKECPFCQAPQRLEVHSQKITRGVFSNPSDVLSWILAINLVLYVGGIVLAPSDALSFSRGLFGFGAPAHEVSKALGMTSGPLLKNGQIWTLVTASFLHGSILHIYFNMDALRNIGQATVAYIGPARFLIAYILTGIGGFLASDILGGIPWFSAPSSTWQYYLFRGSNTLGASASLFGILGVLFVFATRRGGQIGAALQAILRKWIFIGLLIGFLVPIFNNTAHIGGLIIGMLLGFFYPRQEGVAESGTTQLIALLLLGLVFVSFLIQISGQLGFFDGLSDINQIKHSLPIQ